VWIHLHILHTLIDFRKQLGNSREKEREEEKNLEASWGATQFHSFMIEWSSIWMSAM